MLRARGFRRLTPVVATGYLLLAAAAAASIAMRPGWPAIALAVGAALALSTDRRLGPLPAGIIVILALPYDRAANNDLLRLAGIPLRPHDVVAALALILGALAGPWRVPRRPIGPIIAIFLGVGVLATVLGMVLGNELRDIFRDARWWFLYTAGLAALLWGVRREAVLRGLVTGAIAFAAVALATVLLPAFPGGLKERALVYDYGLLRMQFGNSIFLLPAATYLAHRFVRRPSLSIGAGLFLLLTAAALSLTRTFVVVTVLAATATVLWALLRAGGSRRALGAAAGLALIAAVAIGGGIGLNAVETVLNDGTDPLGGAYEGGATPRPTPPGWVEDDPIDRLLFQGESGFETIVAGRFSSYANALVEASGSPLLGRGLGSLVDADYAYGGEAFATPGKLPNVDNAYLTAALKAGALGVAALLAMLLWPLVVGWRGGLGRLAPWFAPAWFGVLAVTMTQSFATTGYGPYTLSLLLATFGVGYAARRDSRARSQL